MLRTSHHLIAFASVEAAASGPSVPYSLHRLAAGSYDLILDGTVVGSVVRDARPGGGCRGWLAELLDDRAERPAPFIAAEHEFASLEEVTDWLGGSTIIDEPKEH